MTTGGAIEALVEARDRGLVRYLGFSAHSEEAALALLDRFDFDSILFPLNWACWYSKTSLGLFDKYNHLWCIVFMKLLDYAKKLGIERLKGLLWS